MGGSLVALNAFRKHANESFGASRCDVSEPATNFQTSLI